LHAGNLLIVDSAGGSSRFADAAEKELKAIFGQLPKLIAPDAPVYNLPNGKIQSFRYRPYAKRINPDSRLQDWSDSNSTGGWRGL